METKAPENTSKTSAELAMDAVFGEQTTSTALCTQKAGAKIVPGKGLVYFTAMGLEATAEHRNVAKAWQDKCEKAPAFWQNLKDAEAHKFDRSVADGIVRLNDDLTLANPINNIDNKPTNNIAFTPHGLLTLAQTAGIPRSMMEFMLSDDKKYADVAADRKATLAGIINEQLDIRDHEWNNPGEDMKKLRRGMKETGKPEPRGFVLRLRDNEDGNPVIRATVSERYTRELTNLQVYELMMECFEDHEIQDLLISHLHHDGDNMIGNLLLPDYMQTCEGDSDYGIGVAFRNSEVKEYLWEILPFAFRAICWNGNIWGRRESKYCISKKHLGNADIDALRAECKRVLTLALSHGQAFLNQMMLTKEVKIANVPQVLAQIAEERKITRAEMGKIVEAYQLPREANWLKTGFGIVQAVTAGAQEVGSESARNALEAIGGDLITPSLDADLATVQKFWQRLEDRAERLTAKEYEWTQKLLVSA